MSRSVTPVERRLESLAEGSNSVAAEDALWYFRGEYQSAPPHSLLMTIRSDDNLCLRCQTITGEWLLAHDPSDVDPGRWIVLETDDDSEIVERVQAQEVEDVLRSNDIEIQLLEETPLADHVERGDGS